MNIPRSRTLAALISLAILGIAAQRAGAVEALLLEDTYVDNGPNGGDPPPNQSNYGAGPDLRVFKGNGRIGRAFLKFSLDTLPPGTGAADIAQARMRLWVNGNTTAVGSITLKPVTSAWDEYELTGRSAENLKLGSPELTDLPINSMNNFVSIDVTRWIKAWLEGTLVNEGIVIEPGSTTDFLDLWFDSKESDQTSHEVRLEITLAKADR